MRTIWHIVDKDGDEIDRSLLHPYKDIPVQMKSVEFRPSMGDPEDPNDIDELHITVEYLHGARA